MLASIIAFKGKVCKVCRTTNLWNGTKNILIKHDSQDIIIYYS